MRAPAWKSLIVWTLHGACLAAAIGFAAVFAMMATSLDPMEMINAGAEPWTNALVGILAALGVGLVSAAGLACWHSRRFRALGIVLLAIEIGGLLWAGVAIYAEYS